MKRIAGIRHLFRRDRGAADVERDVDDELRFHFDMAVQELIAAGRTPRDAQREAEARFGDVAAARARLAAIDRTRVSRARRAEWWESVVQDIRYGARSLRRSPGFTLASVLTLAIGIGANTAIVSVVDGVLLRGAPFTDIDRIAMVWETDRNSGTTREPSSIPDYRDFRGRSRQFSQLTAFTPVEVNYATGTGDPRRLAGLGVSKEYFGTIGLSPMAGRGFNDDEDQAGGPRAVVISDDLWDRQFRRDRAALGQTLRINDVEWTIVGIMPRGADFGTLQVLGAAAYQRGFADRGDRVRVDVWMPLRANPAAARGNHPIFVMGRLAPSASIATAQDEMTSITAALEGAYHADNFGRGAHVEALDAVVFGPVRPAMLVFLAAVALVLLVACVNVANLLLVRATSRVREVTVRTALGAATGRLAQQYLVEAALLVGTGTVLGVGVAYAMVNLLMSMAPAMLPRIAEVGVDGRVLVVTAGVSALIALVFGILPTLQARRVDLQGALREEGGRGASAGRSQRRLRSSFVVAQLAMATMLMVGAGLLMRTLWTIEGVNPGFDASHVLKAEFQLPPSRYPQNFSRFPDWPEQKRFFTEVGDRLAAMPAVSSVAFAAANPMDAGFTSSIRVVGRETEGADWPEPSIRTVSPGYFTTLKVQLRAGRTFEAGDVGTGTTVVLINEAAGRRYFEGRDPLGQQLRLWGSNRTVVGIVANERFKGLTEPAAPAVYLPLDQAPTANAVLVRMEGDASAAAPLIRQVVRDVDPQLPVFGVQPLTETVRSTMAQRRFTMLVLITFAFAAVVLAVVGVHGVLAYVVAERTREIGIRVAFGAGKGEVRSLVVAGGMRLTVLGVGMGLLGAALLAQMMRTLLFGVSARDPLTFGVVTVLLVSVALIACWLPARRATRVDPMLALRAD